MKFDSLNEVEKLLEQMKLQEPSEGLDVAIGKLASSHSFVAAFDEGAESELGSPQYQAPAMQNAGRFGWSALAITALAASMVGVLVGQFVSPSSGHAVVVEQGGVGAKQGQKNLTRVKFNVNAFKLMHGHSQKQEFAKCDACHKTANGKKGEAFDGWFYGDEDFFRIHQFYKQQKKVGGLENCVACHVIKAEPAIKKGDLVPPTSESRAHKFDGGDCLDCHQVNVDDAGLRAKS